LLPLLLTLTLTEEIASLLALLLTLAEEVVGLLLWLIEDTVAASSEHS
jgi:hypothetical protein